MSGKCADLVEDAAYEECPVVPSGFSRINLVNRVRTACNVMFQSAPCFLPFFFFGSVFFREQLHGFQKFLTPFQEFVVSVLIGILCHGKTYNSNLICHCIIIFGSNGITVAARQILHNLCSGCFRRFKIKFVAGNDVRFIFLHTFKWSLSKHICQKTFPGCAGFFYVITVIAIVIQQYFKIVDNGVSIFFKCGYDLCNFCIDRCIFCFRRTVSTIILDRNGICQFIVGEQVAIAVINISACTV